jgi:hypothetical protein
MANSPVPSFGDYTNLLFVDGGTSVGVTEQEGSLLAPFSTIQAALDVIPTATNAAESRRVFGVVITPGDYDEDLSLDIAGKRVLLLSWGPWGLGTFDTADWAPSGTRRNITISGAAATIDGIRTAFGIATLPEIGQRYTTHQSYFTGARISGQILITATGGSIELDLEAEVFGTTGASGGVSLDATANNPILQMYLYKGRWRGQILGGTNSQFQHASETRFNGLVSVGAYSLIDRCRIDGGFTVAAAGAAGLQPQGFLNSVFTGGTFTGPAGSLRLDVFTDYWVRTNAIVLAGGATKVLYGESLGGTGDGVSYTAASAANWSGSPPTNLKDALDRIAAAIGPIA